MKVDIRSLTTLLSSSSSCLLRIRMKRLHCCIHNKYFTTKVQFKTEKDPEAVSDLVWTVQQAMFRFVKYSGGGASHELNDVVITYLLTYATCCYWWIMVLTSWIVEAKSSILLRKTSTLWVWGSSFGRPWSPINVTRKGTPFYTTCPNQLLLGLRVVGKFLPRDAL